MWRTHYQRDHERIQFTPRDWVLFAILILLALSTFALAYIAIESRYTPTAPPQEPPHVTTP